MEDMLTIQPSAPSNREPQKEEPTKQKISRGMRAIQVSLSIVGILILFLAIDTIGIFVYEPGATTVSVDWEYFLPLLAIALVAFSSVWGIQKRKLWARFSGVVALLFGIGIVAFFILIVATTNLGGTNSSP